MSKKTPPYKEYLKWTEAKFFAWVRSGLRKAYIRWPPKNEVVTNAKRNIKKPNGNQKFEYRCADCTKYHKRTEVEVDHIEECGSLRSFDDIGVFASKLFVGVDKLQVLCKKCHQKKTNAAREARKANL